MTNKTNKTPEISVIVPMRNEAGNVAQVIDEIVEALEGRSFEIIAVDDGSTDETRNLLKCVAAREPRLRSLGHTRSCGQSEAIRSGVFAARAPLIATLDGDGQNPPWELPVLIDRLVAGGPILGLVQGQRVGRKDSAWKRFGSRIGNGVRSALLRDGVRDTGCGLKAFRRDVYLRLPYFAHLHRFMPAMVIREGYEVVVQDVTHRDRIAGVSNYGNFGRALVGLYDLVGVTWLIRRHPRKPPDHYETT